MGNRQGCCIRGRSKTQSGSPRLPPRSARGQMAAEESKQALLHGTPQQMHCLFIAK